ncbi:glycosyltransferase [bacterium]|nr:glycosyltransferase [bacterium]
MIELPSSHCSYSSAGFDESLKNNLAPDVGFAVVRGKAGRDWRLVRKLANIFVKQRVDIVHSHNWETWLYSFPAARLAHLPVFILGEYGREATYLSERSLKQKCGIQIRVK